MATQHEIEQHYDTLGALHALRMEDVQGDFPDYTCAFFDGDFTKSYKDAQRDKHQWILNGIGLFGTLKGKRVLDIGCGWGPMLKAVEQRFGKAIGLTLSPHQVEHCRRHNLEARLRDYKTLGPGELGMFDGVVSVGAFEHFCSIKDMQAGKQEKVYRDFFRICAEHLPPGGGLYLQTMTWGKEVPNYNKLSFRAPEGTKERILARMEHLYPGSWLPNGLEQIVKCASPYFDFVSHNNGRRDYLRTLECWHEATPNLLAPRNIARAAKIAIPLTVETLSSFLFTQEKKAWHRWRSVVIGDQTTCFRDEIMSHERIFFKKKAVH